MTSHGIYRDVEVLEWGMGPGRGIGLELHILHGDRALFTPREALDLIGAMLFVLSESGMNLEDALEDIERSKVIEDAEK